MAQIISNLRMLSTAFIKINLLTGETPGQLDSSCEFFLCKSLKF